MKTSVVICTRNDCDTIIRAVESVLSSRQKPDAIVIGDNDSDDATYVRLCDYIQAAKVNDVSLPPHYTATIDDVQVTILRHKRAKTGQVMNVAMSAAPQDTSVVLFLDPKDWYHPDKIGETLKAFSDPTVMCVTSDRFVCHRDYKVREFLLSFRHDRMMLASVYDWNFAVKTTIFKTVGPMDQSLDAYCDYDFLMRLVEHGLMHHIPAPLHYHTHRPMQDDDVRESIAEKALTRRTRSVQTQIKTS